MEFTIFLVKVMHYQDTNIVDIESELAGEEARGIMDDRRRDREEWDDEHGH